MNEQDKQLVFQDLCARLPHHICVKVWLKDGTTEEGVLDLEHNYGDVLRDAFYYNKIKDIKPYLRPRSSMTNEEAVEYHELCDVLYGVYFNTIDSIKWLYAHHFDVDDLIPAGLAIEVTKENGPYL